MNSMKKQKIFDTKDDQLKNITDECMKSYYDDAFHRDDEYIKNLLKNLIPTLKGENSDEN